MAEEQFNKEDSGNEYQFKDEQELPEYKYEEPPPASAAGKFKKRPLATAIGVLIAIFVVYEIIH